MDLIGLDLFIASLIMIIITWQQLSWVDRNEKPSHQGNPKAEAGAK